MPDKAARIDFAEHLRTEHRIGKVSEFLKEIVYGGNDGIVTTFAVVAGFSGAAMYEAGAEVATVAVLLFGLANLFADATAMGLGAFLSSRSEHDVYNSVRAKELNEIRTNPAFERRETVEILEDRGIPTEDAEAFAELYLRHPEHMADFMMRYEIGMSDPSDDSPARSGLATFLSFVFFGAIPLIPYFLLDPTETTFRISIAATFAALVMLGLVRWRVTSETVARCVTETVLVGGVCAVVAYTVGIFFRM